VEKTLTLEADSITIYQMELPLNTVFVRDARDGGGQTPVADWSTKREWVDWAFDRCLERGYSISSGYTLVRDSARVHFHYRDMLWEGSDLVALGVASFGHLSGVHYQNATHWDDYLAAVEAGRLPIHRGLAPTPRELLIRELVLGLKRGRLDTGRLSRKFGVDPLAEWADQWRSLESEGYLERTASGPVLSRRGLLQIDSLLPRFFDA
jgi:oxygen-independent coproporphyrinogen-3 oxidase